MSFEYYDRGQALIGGAPVADLVGGTIDFGNGFRPVETINKGYAGGSKGSVTATITCKRPVLRAGVPKGQDLHSAVLKQTPISGMVICGAKKYTVTGVPTGIRRDFGVGETAMEDFSLFGSVEVDDV